MNPTISQLILVDLIKHFGKFFVKPQSTPFPQKLKQEKKTFISKSTTTWTKEFSHVDFTIPHIQVMQLLEFPPSKSHFPFIPKS
jgi:hypothetical protein